MVNTWSYGPHGFFVEVRGGLQMEIAQSDPCTFSADKTPTESPTARHRGPNKGGNVHLIDVRLKARVLFPETNNQAAWRVPAKWLKHSSKHSNETVNKKRLPWHAIGNHRTVTFNIHLPETPEVSHMSELDK